jgi:hypothetical protein
MCKIYLIYALMYDVKTLVVHGKQMINVWS